MEMKPLWLYCLTKQLRWFQFGGNEMDEASDLESQDANLPTQTFAEWSEMSVATTTLPQVCQDYQPPNITASKSVFAIGTTELIVTTYRCFAL